MKNKSLYPYFLIPPIYLLTFLFAEKHVVDGRFVSYLPLDDKIPFISAFVVPYVLWYVLIFGVGIYLFKKDHEGFKRYMSFIGISFFSIIILNMLFPNEQNLRADLTFQEGVFVKAVAFIYSVDTNTNVCPSMHVVGALGAVFSVWQRRLSKFWRYTLTVLGIFICLSTVFIKQHSLLDVIIAIPYAVGVWIIVNKLIFRKSFVHQIIYLISDFPK